MRYMTAGRRKEIIDFVNSGETESVFKQIARQKKKYNKNKLKRIIMER